MRDEIKVPDFDAWVFPCAFEEVLDGDTVRLLVDVGFDARVSVKLRVADLWCPEVRGESRESGLRSKLGAALWLRSVQESSDLEFPLWVECYGRRSFSRWVGSLFSRETGESFAEYMVVNGFGTEVRR